MSTVLGQLALLLVISFLLGSIPWGVIISRVFYHTDLREHGSGNIGTTNAIRTMGKVGGYAVFVLDFGKGSLRAYCRGIRHPCFLAMCLPLWNSFKRLAVRLIRSSISSRSALRWRSLVAPWAIFSALGWVLGEARALRLPLAACFPRLALLEPCLKLRFSLFWLWQQSMFLWDPLRQLRHVPSLHCISSGATPLPLCCAC